MILLYSCRGGKRVKETDLHREEIMAKSRLFKSISNPVCLCILDNLRKNPEMCVSDFCTCMEASQPLVSKHLIAMKDKGILKSETRGQFVWYSLDNDVVRKILDLLEEMKGEF